MTDRRGTPKAAGHSVTYPRRGGLALGAGQGRGPKADLRTPYENPGAPAGRPAGGGARL